GDRGAGPGRLHDGHGDPRDGAGGRRCQFRRTSCAYKRGINGQLSVTLFSDPACPWGYSENPALRVIEWRYGDQLDWRLVLVGLSEDVSRYAEHGFTPLRMASGGLMFRDRYGMPFAVQP